MSTPKVRQIATCTVVFVTKSVEDVKDGFQALLDSSSSPSVSWYVEYPAGKSHARANGWTMGQAKVSYAAKGANRNDIHRRVAKYVDAAAFIDVSPSEITKLGV